MAAGSGILGSAGSVSAKAHHFSGIMSNRVIPLSVQLGKLKHYFPNSTNYMDIHTNRLIWKTTLQPSELLGLRDKSCTPWGKVPRCTSYHPNHWHWQTVRNVCLMSMIMSSNSFVFIMVQRENGPRQDDC